MVKVELYLAKGFATADKIQPLPAHHRVVKHITSWELYQEQCLIVTTGAEFGFSNANLNELL